MYSYFGGVAHTPATFGVLSFGAHTRESFLSRGSPRSPAAIPQWTPFKVCLPD